MMNYFFIKHKVFFSIFFISVIAGGFLFFYASSSMVALVDRELIWKKDFNETLDLMIKYYGVSNHNMTTGVSSSNLLEDKDFLKQVQKESLERMIEYKILAAELESSGLNWKERTRFKIDNAIAKIKEQDKFEEGVRTLYGMSLSEFERKVLIPQAQFEIVSEELKKQNKNYDEWLKDKKRGLNVRIMIEGLEWKEGEVVIK